MNKPNTYMLATLIAIVCGSAFADPNVAFDRLYEQSRNEDTGNTDTESFFKFAQQAAGQPDASFANMGQLANYLADDFTLFSNIQHEVIQAHCQTLDKDIGDYLDTLDARNTKDAEVVKRIYARLNNSYDSIWVKMKPYILADLDNLLASWSAEVDSTTDRFCLKLADQPEDAALRLRYAALRPARSQILRAISP